MATNKGIASEACWVCGGHTGICGTMRSLDQGKTPVGIGRRGLESECGEVEKEGV